MLFKFFVQLFIKFNGGVIDLDDPFLDLTIINHKYYE